MRAAYWNFLTLFEEDDAMSAKDGMTCNRCPFGNINSVWCGWRAFKTMSVVSVTMVKATSTFNFCTTASKAG